MDYNIVLWLAVNVINEDTCANYDAIEVVINRKRIFFFINII